MQAILKETEERFAEDEVLDALTIFDWASVPTSEPYGDDKIRFLIQYYRNCDGDYDWNETSLLMQWRRLRNELLEERATFDRAEEKKASEPEEAKKSEEIRHKEKRQRESAALDDFYAKIFNARDAKYCQTMQFLMSCYCSLVLSSVCCECGFSLMKAIKSHARTRLLII